MASGFDGFATGLLGSINQDFDNKRKQQDEGDKAQLQVFQEAEHEYNQSKAKVADSQAKIEAMANIISGGKPNAAAYATARDAVELGYTGQEHMPYVQSAYKATYDDMKHNPDRWGVPATPHKDLTEDTNPSQTAVIKKFNPNMQQSDIENVRQHNIDRPYSGLPGAQWGDPAATANKTLYDKALMENKAKNDVEQSNSSRQDAMFGLNQGAEASSQSAPQMNGPTVAPQPPMQPQQASTALQDAGSAGTPPPASAAPSSSMQTPASQLQPNAAEPQTPPSTGGIQLNGPAPADTTQQDQSQVTAPQSTDQINKGLNVEYLNSLPPAIAGQIKLVAEGKIPITGAMLRATSKDPMTFWDRVLLATSKYDPTFDVGNYNARNAMRISYAKGEDHKTIVAENNALGHLNDYVDASAKLNNVHQGNFGPLTDPYNAVRTTWMAGQGDNRVNDVQGIRAALAGELTKAYSGNKGALEEVNNFMDRLSKNNSPEEQVGIAKTFAKLLASKIAAQEHEYSRVMGPAVAENTDFYTGTAKKAMERFGVDVNSVRSEAQQQEPLSMARPDAGTSAPAIEPQVPTGDVAPIGVDQKTGLPIVKGADGQFYLKKPKGQ